MLVIRPVNIQPRQKFEGSLSMVSEQTATVDKAFANRYVDRPTTAIQTLQECRQ